MTARDRTAAALAARGETPGDVDADPPDVIADAALEGGELAPVLTGAPGSSDTVPGDDTWALDLDTTLDRATAARLREESRRSRPRVAARLAMAGHLPAGSDRTTDGTVEHRSDPPSVDEHRNLSARLDENVAFFEHIDALHDRRLHSPSPRERQVATRALAEALHRIVAGYQVDTDQPHRPIVAARRADEWLGRLYDRVAARGPSRQGASRWWARDGRWVRLVLALLASVLLAGNHVVGGALAVTTRSLLSGVLYAPAPPVSQRRRLLGYDPGWASCVLTHMGDAAILVGLGLGLHLGGHSAWGAAAVLAALFRLLATMIRVASGQQGFRIPRLWLDRAATTLALPVAVIAAAVVPPEGPGVVAGVPVAVVALGTVAAIGVVEIARTVYWALCRRRLFRRAAVALGGLVPDAIVAHTADGIVVNLQREATTRPPVFDLAD
ncbi:MAG: hypothetical protein JXA83_01540, partial [Acidimicrobiales bacterium]|nr:hypothetical protein [Acidimicrobiales bacterium]